MWLQYNFHIWSLGFSQGYIWIQGLASDHYREMSQSQNQYKKYSDALKWGVCPVFKNISFTIKI